VNAISDLFHSLQRSVPDRPTSSPGSASGPTRSAPQAGPTTCPSGQVPAPASPSRKRGAKRASTTSATSGPSGSGSSSSARLQSSLESRLRARTAGLGSTLFRLIWKEQVTPSGHRICQLRASAPRTSARGSTSWPSPQARDGLGGRGGQAARALPGSGRSNLDDAVMLAGPWPTPTAQDSVASGARDYAPTATHHAGTTLTDASKMVLSAWPTPVSCEGAHGPSAPGAGGRDGGNLSHAATLAGWATPVSTEIGNTLEGYRAMKANMATGRREAITHPSLQAQLVLSTADPLQASGSTSTGSPVATGKRGQLSPEHSRWLMGLPTGWAACAATETRSVRPSRRRSSRR
jgi:hypothetical protein